MEKRSVFFLAIAALVCLPCYAYNHITCDKMDKKKGCVSWKVCTKWEGGDQRPTAPGRKCIKWDDNVKLEKLPLLPN